MKHYLEDKIIEVLNKWLDGFSPVKNSIVQIDVSKHKYRNLYLKKTGEFLKIPQKLETQLFSKIVLGLSTNNEIDDKIIDEYLEWCFENYEIIIKQYKSFNLQNIANFAVFWRPNLFKSIEIKKPDLESLSSLNVADNVFLNCEKYGISLVATKLAKEKKLSTFAIKTIVNKKLQELTQDITGLSKLRNMLRKTVENGPYFTEIVFSDYQNDLKVFFDKFKGEPWCVDVV